MTTRPLLTALCCTCGTVRSTTDKGGSSETVKPESFAFMRQIIDGWEPKRCLVRRKCATCGEQTQHAYLRDDEDRDEVEIADHLDALPAQLGVHAILNELQARDVDIRYLDEAPSRRPGLELAWYLAENTWAVFVIGVLPITSLAGLLRQAQATISEPGGLKWWPYPETDVGEPRVGVKFPYREGPESA